MISNKREFPKAFKIFCITLILLAFGGSLILFSASSRIAFNIEGNANSFFESHIKYLIISALIGLIFFLFDYKSFKRITWFFIIVTFSLLLMTLVKKYASGNSQPVRWLAIGGHNIFQLAEIVKFTLILYVSAYLANHQDNLDNLKKGYLPVILISGTLITMIALTPDLSSAVMLFFIVLTMLYIGGAKIKHIGFTSLILMILGGVYTWIEPYRRARILAIFNPDDVSNANYQINQSLISLSGGGLFGRGFGNSTGKNLFLPEAHTDFIFSIAGEELGFITTLLILIIFITLFISMLRLAKSVKDSFGKYVIFGTAFSLILYAIANALVCVGIGPVTGLPMPFISKSGSQLLINLSLLGICMNAMRQAHYEEQKEAEFLHDL
ncbi:MAG: FtsW/RodA/SpoVE family cell cycle protein [Candidatus Neomarinimicrobiota bacterium]